MWQTHKSRGQTQNTGGEASKTPGGRHKKFVDAEVKYMKPESLVCSELLPKFIEQNVQECLLTQREKCVAYSFTKCQCATQWDAKSPICRYIPKTPFESFWCLLLLNKSSGKNLPKQCLLTSGVSWSANRASLQSCMLFVDNFARSRPATSETETLLRRPQEPHYPKRHRVSGPRVFSLWLHMIFQTVTLPKNLMTGGWRDDVVDMKMWMLIMTIVCHSP